MALIYVADDQADILSAIEGFLRREGFEVRGFSDGADLIRAVKEDPPDLVVTDVYMPNMDGIEVLIRLGAAEPRVPIVVMSGGGYTPKEYVLTEADHLGAAALITKPFKMAGLVATVRRVLAEVSEAGSG